MKNIRFSFDNFMRASIKFFTLTGVAVTVTACYGPPPGGWDDPSYQADTQQVEQQLTIEEQPLAE